MKNRIPKEQVTSSEIILYQTEDGQSRIQVRLEAQRELDMEGNYPDSSNKGHYNNCEKGNYAFFLKEETILWKKTLLSEFRAGGLGDYLKKN